MAAPDRRLTGLRPLSHPHHEQTQTSAARRRGGVAAAPGGEVEVAVAQFDGFQDPLSGALKPAVTVKATFAATLIPATAKPGDEVTLKVTAILPPKSYIFATTGDFEQKTKISTTNIVGLKEVDTDFTPDHPPKVQFDPVLKQELSKLYGDVTWSKKYRIEPTADLKNVAVDLQLEGQYCSEGPGGTCNLIQPPQKLHAALVVNEHEKPKDPFTYSVRPTRGKTNPALLEMQLGPTKASGGKIVKLGITMKLDPEWHTFSTTFKGDGGTATEIALELVYGLKPLGEGFVPDRPPEIKIEKELKLEQEVYHESVTWTREFEVLPNFQPGAFGVEGTITYQACNLSCIPPRSVPFELGITSDDIDPPATITPYRELEPVVSVHVPQRPQDKGLVVFLLTAIAAAMAALLTPCVFPMVPITVSFFLKQNENKGGRPVLLAFVFSAAIIASFVVIGVGIAALFGAAKATELANNWILNLFLATIFFAFALNMLGMFEIQVPAWLLNFTATKEQTGGYVGVIFMALTFVLTSFSCTFAFVGSLLAAAAKGEYYWPVLGMLAFGTTFAAPFFVLALMPRTLKSLPKSGGWLNSVKVVMGFVEIGIALKYISVVDQQWNAVPWIFDFTNVMAMWAILAVGTGLYLLGQFRLLHDAPMQGLSAPRVLLAFGFLMLGGLFAVGLTQPDRETWLVNQLISFAPARLNHELFETDFDVAVKNASAKNHPLFIDFTGVFCNNCRLMEIRMAKTSNRSRLERFVQVQLYTDKVPDVSDPKEEKRIRERNISLQINWLGDVTLPSYAIATPDGKTILASFAGMEQRDGEFAKFLDQGFKKWESLKVGP